MFLCFYFILCNLTIISYNLLCVFFLFVRNTIFPNAKKPKHLRKTHATFPSENTCTLNATIFLTRKSWVGIHPRVWAWWWEKNLPMVVPQATKYNLKYLQTKNDRMAHAKIYNMFKKKKVRVEVLDLYVFNCNIPKAVSSFLEEPQTTKTKNKKKNHMVWNLVPMDIALVVFQSNNTFVPDFYTRLLCLSTYSIQLSLSHEIIIIGWIYIVKIIQNYRFRGRWRF